MNEGPATTHRDVHKSDVDPSEFPMLLKQYYDRLFPYSKFYKWLSYGNTQKDYFSNREFSFTLKDDIYIRYRSYKDEEEMTADIKEMCPYKIDIGAVFSGKVRGDRLLSHFHDCGIERSYIPCEVVRNTCWCLYVSAEGPQEN